MHKLVLSLGEKEVELKFNMGTLRRMKQLSGVDPFAMMNNLNDADSITMHEFACHAFQAGVMTNYNTDSSGFSQLQLDDLSMKQVTDIVTSFVKAYTPEQEAASTEDTQPVNAG